jgi:hypothetical protein
MLAALSSAAGAFLLLQSVHASTPVFTYGDRDLILCFRQDLTLPAQTQDLEVDIGPATNYYGAAIGSVLQVNQSGTYNTSLLNSTFSSLDTLSWSVSGCVPNAGDSGDPAYPPDTLWLTSPRLAPLVLGTAWLEYGANPQAAVANEIGAIQFNAGQYSATLAQGPANTGSAILIPVGSFSCDPFLGPVQTLPQGGSSAIGNFIGKFQGNVENTTPADFTTNPMSQPSRSDLYVLEPAPSRTNPAGTYLGYFELETNGSMLFYRLAAPPPALGVAVSGTTSTISFLTGVGATYTLYYTNAAGLFSPVGTWTKVTGNVTGDGTVKSFQVTTTDTNRFYEVQDH